jgi:hypothetical protein
MKWLCRLVSMSGAFKYYFLYKCPLPVSQTSFGVVSSDSGTDHYIIRELLDPVFNVF